MLSLAKIASIAAVLTISSTAHAVPLYESNKACPTPQPKDFDITKPFIISSGGDKPVCFDFAATGHVGACPKSVVPGQQNSFKQIDGGFWALAGDSTKCFGEGAAVVTPDGVTIIGAGVGPCDPKAATATSAIKVAFDSATGVISNGGEGKDKVCLAPVDGKATADVELTNCKTPVPDNQKWVLQNIPEASFDITKPFIVSSINSDKPACFDLANAPHHIGPCPSSVTAGATNVFTQLDNGLWVLAGNRTQCFAKGSGGGAVPHMGVAESVVVAPCNSAPSTNGEVVLVSWDAASGQINEGTGFTVRCLAPIPNEQETFIYLLSYCPTDPVPDNHKWVLKNI